MKKKRNISFFANNEKNHQKKADEEGIDKLDSSYFDRKILKNFNVENICDKEDNSSISIDESSCSSNEEYTTKENINTTSESKKLCKLATELAAKFDIQTLERLVSLGPKAVLMEYNTRLENKITVRSNDGSDDDSNVDKFKGCQSKHLGSTQRSENENKKVEMPGSQSFESEPICADKSLITYPSKIPGLDNLFSGDMFLVKDPILGIPLNTGTFVYYCLQEKYILAENATSATMAGRRLLDGVFTHEALSACSLSGMPPRGKGKTAYADKSSIKPYLCPKAVAATTDKALQLQKIKHWHPKKDCSQIRQAMAVRMNEIASKHTQKNTL